MIECALGVQACGYFCRRMLALQRTVSDGFLTTNPLRPQRFVVPLASSVPMMSKYCSHAEIFKWARQVTKVASNGIVIPEALSLAAYCPILDTVDIETTSRAGSNLSGVLTIQHA